MENRKYHPNVQLLPGEELLDVKEFAPPPKPERPPSSLRELFRLTAATKPSEIGLFGPSVAALPASNYEPEVSENMDTPEHQGLFDVVFGRDSLRVAKDLVHAYPRLAATTLHKLAELQGLHENTSREEEPGRIVHEVRDPNHDPIAQKLTEERGWGWPYYGSVDATPEFVRTLAAYCHLNQENNAFLFHHYKDRDGKDRIIADSLTFAVDWITNRLDSNPEGLLEFKSVIPGGIENQVWKDSPDAYHHADGTIANHDDGIASIEVQTVTYDALLDAARLYETVLNRKEEAEALKERAHQLGLTILDKFWTDDQGGYFVLGTDRDQHGNLRQLKVKTSNMGHVLNSRLLDGPDERRTHMRLALLRRLTSPELLTVAGIRTLASDEVRYREGAYHNGSVWIWDTHHIAQGARRHISNPAFLAFANDLDGRILNVVNTIGGFPEYARGGNQVAVNQRTVDVFDKTLGKVNRIEQPPQQVQAWTVAAILATKRRRGERTYHSQHV